MQNLHIQFQGYEKSPDFPDLMNATRNGDEGEFLLVLEI
jgi:hypothetical protein